MDEQKQKYINGIYEEQNDPLLTLSIEEILNTAEIKKLNNRMWSEQKLKKYNLFELDLDNELMKIESLSVEDLQFFQYCSKEIKKIEEKIEKIEKQDSEAIESLYRMNKMMSGLLEVYNF